MGPTGHQDNLLQLPPEQAEGELFHEVLRRPGVRIERIISHGEVTPVDQHYVQGWDEWVLLVEGSAVLWLDGMGERRLERGDHLLIAAGTAHRVTYTADPTIWLAVHLDEA